MLAGCGTSSGGGDAATPDLAAPALDQSIALDQSVPPDQSLAGDLVTLPDLAIARSPDAGGLGAACASDVDCTPGLLCCYPCGIPGCTPNRCTAPMNGRCPMYP